jgi:VWFA-related protein
MKQGFVNRPAATLVAAILICLAPAARSSPQAPDPSTPSFAGRVEVVTVDVVVVDAKGRAVPGLQRPDFTVLEDGVPQNVTSFQSIELPSTPPPPAVARAPQAPVSTNERAESRPGRTFVVVFDDVHLSPEQALRAKAVVGQFLKAGVREGDLVTLIATGGGAWWNTTVPEGREELVTILKRLDGRYIPESSPDRVTDYEAMRIMAFEDAEVAYMVQRRFDSYGTVGRERSGDRTYGDTRGTSSRAGLIDPYVRARATDVYRQLTERRKLTLGTMARALESLGAQRGRKAMVLVSQGFVYEQNVPEMRRLVEASTRVNVPIHFIDTRGLKALPDFMTASFSVGFDVQDTVAVLADITREAEGAESMALDTGGLVVKNTNDVAGGLIRVANESQAYYLIGYTPSNVARDGRFRKIEVKLAPGRGKGLKIRARRGYYAPSPAGEAPRDAPKDPDVIRALDSPFERPEIPLQVAGYAFDETSTLNRISVMIAVDVALREVQLEEVDGRFKGAIAFLVEAQHRETGEYYRTDEKIEMSLLPETRERLRQEWHTVGREFAMPPGGYQVKVVVRDLGSGRIGSVIHNFDVPEPLAFRLSTPVLSDALEKTDPQKPDAASRPVLRAGRRFRPGSTLWVQYSVLGAAKEEATRLPDVTAAYEIRRVDGPVFKSAQPTRINPTSLGSLLRLNGIRLDGAEPGDYLLVLRVRDVLAGRDLEVQEPFTIAAG